MDKCRHIFRFLNIRSLQPYKLIFKNIITKRINKKNEMTIKNCQV